MLAGQLLVGVAIGMDFPAASAYVAETMPAAERQKMVVGTITFQAVGMVLASLLGVWLLARSGSPEGWRWLFAALAVLAILFFTMRLAIPESPHWLAAHGRLAEAARVALRLNPGGLVAAGPAEPPASAEPPPRGFGALFAPAFLRLTILTAGAWFLMDIATYGVGIFTPVILQSLDPAAGIDSTLVYREIHTGRAAGLVDLFLLLGFLMGIWLVPRAGAVRMQILGFAGMAAGMLVLAWASALPGAGEFRAPHRPSGLRPVQPRHEHGPELDHLHPAGPALPDQPALHRQRLRRRLRQGRRHLGNVLPARSQGRFRHDGDAADAWQAWQRSACW